MGRASAGRASAGLWRRYWRARGSYLGTAIIGVLAVLAVAAPLAAPRGPFKMDLSTLSQPPSLRQPLGTDRFGRGMFERVVWGSRVSLAVGLVAATVSGLLGTTVGLVAGYRRDSLGELLMRVVDGFLAIPTFFLALSILAIFGGNIFLTVAVIALSIWPSTARLVRAEVLSLRDRDFVQAARALGMPEFRILLRHLLPNAIHPAVVNTSLQVGTAILIESGLSFLGMGDPSWASWGWMLNDALVAFRTAWWTAVSPGLAITLTVIGFNLMGDALNDALNPRLLRNRG